MIEINIMVPLFTVPEYAEHQKIVEEIIKFTGFQKVHIYELEEGEKVGVLRKDNKIKKLCAEVSDLKISMLQISKVAERVAELNRQNAILRKDLADLYIKYKQLKREELNKSKSGLNEPIKLQSNKQIVGNDLVEEEQQVKGKSETKMKSNKLLNQHCQEDHLSLHRQIRELVSDKISKEQIIQKLSVYCKNLIKIIQTHKIPIV